MSHGIFNTRADGRPDTAALGVFDAHDTPGLIGSDHFARTVIRTVIDDQIIRITFLRLTNRIKDDRGGIALKFSGNNRNSNACSPRLQLFYRGGAEGISGSYDDALSLGCQ